VLGGCKETGVVPSASENQGKTESNSFMYVDLLGEVSTHKINDQGILQEPVTFISNDENLRLDLQEGTSIGSEKSNFIDEFTVTINHNPPSLPEGYAFVSPVYSLSPEQTKLSLSGEIRISYAQDQLPTGVAEDDLFMANFPYIACCKVYEEWDVPKNQTTDTATNAVTAQFSDLLQYAVVAELVSSSADTFPVQPAPTPDEPLKQNQIVEVVYFHRAQRCHSCVYIEDMVNHTLETYFEKQLNDGSITYAVYNVEDEKNKSIIEKYNAYTSSLFINTVRDGEDHIDEITSVWLVVDDDEAFINEFGDLLTQALTGDQ
jgi:hypothetical protein